MPACLYCTNAANSCEHPLPAGLGEFINAPLLENRVCKHCNNERLGQLDEQLTRCGPEAFFRRFFGVKGRDTHDEINPFYRGSAGAPRLQAKSYDTTMGTEVELEMNQGLARQLCQLVITDGSGKAHQIPITNKTTPESLRGAYIKLGLTQPSNGHLVCDPEERIWAEPLIKVAFPTVSFGESAPSAQNFNGAAVQIRVTDKYFRALAKIGFHYFLTQFPVFSGAEARFSEIRQFIAESGATERINLFVGLRENPLLQPMMVGARPDGWRAHILCAEAREECTAHIQLFVCQEYPAPTWTVRLATNPSREIVTAQGHLYRYFDDGQSGRFSGEAHIIVPTCTVPASPLKPAVNF